MKKLILLKLAILLSLINIHAQSLSSDSLLAHPDNCLDVPSAEVNLLQAVLGPVIDGFVLIDPVADKDVRFLKSTDTLFTGTPYNIRIDASRAESVRIRLGSNFNRVENQAPFSLKGDTRGDYAPWFPTPGVYTLTATPYSQKFGQGTEGPSMSIQLVVLVPPAVQFVLINADTDTEIMEVKEGTVIDLGQLPTSNLNIRADINQGTTQSVKFGLNEKTSFRIENVAPYALFGDINGDYNAWNPLPGTYTLTATAFSGDRATGTMGPTETIHFTIVRTVPTTASYIEFNNLVVLYHNSNVGQLPPGIRERMEDILEQTSLFYWRHSHMKFKINWTIIEIEEFRDIIKGNAYIFPSDVDAELRALGYMPSFTPGPGTYDAVYAVANGSGNYAWGANVILGRGGYFQTGFWDEKENFWVAVHEFNHVVDAMFNFSGHPSYPHNHPGAARALGEFVPHSGGNWDLNKEIIQFWDKEKWQALNTQGRWGIIKTTTDVDRDGIPDSDPSVPLDEGILGSDKTKIDSDGDGLTDLQDVMAGIFAGTDPLNPDTDGDGINDLMDGEPLYPFNTSVPLVSSLSINSSIFTWPKAGQYYYDHPNHSSAELYLGNSSDNLYIGVRAQTAFISPIHIFIDADNDGIFYGKDNLEIILSGNTIQSVKLFDAASVPPGNESDFFISEITSTGFAGTSKSVTGTVTYQLVIPHLSQYGLNLTPGEKIGINVSIDNYGSVLEYNDLIGLTLGQTDMALKGGLVNTSSQEESGIAVYPNPTENYLNVSWDTFLKPDKIRIINVDGEEVYSGGISGDYFRELNIESLPSGIYSVQIEGNGEIRTMRFIKK